MRKYDKFLFGAKHFDFITTLLFILLLTLQFSKHAKIDVASSVINYLSILTTLCLCMYIFIKRKTILVYNPSIFIGLLLIFISMLFAGSERSTLWICTTIAFYFCGYIYAARKSPKKNNFWLLVSISIFQIVFGSFATQGLNVSALISCIQSGFFGEVKRCYLTINEPSYVSLTLVALVLCVKRTRYNIGLMLVTLASLSLKSTLLYFMVPLLFLLSSYPYSIKALILTIYSNLLEWDLIVHKITEQLRLLTLKAHDLGYFKIENLNIENLYVVYFLSVLLIGILLRSDSSKIRFVTAGLILLAILKFDLTNSLFLAFSFAMIIGSMTSHDLATKN